MGPVSPFVLTIWLIIIKLMNNWSMTGAGHHLTVHRVPSLPFYEKILDPPLRSTETLITLRQNRFLLWTFHFYVLIATSRNAPLNHNMVYLFIFLQVDTMLHNLCYLSSFIMMRTRTLFSGSMVSTVMNFTLNRLQKSSIWNYKRYNLLF